MGWGGCCIIPERLDDGRREFCFYCIVGVGIAHREEMEQWRGRLEESWGGGGRNGSAHHISPLHVLKKPFMHVM